MLQSLFTRHAKQRLRQRGSRAKDVMTVITYGDIEVEARDGCRYVQLSDKEASRLQREGVLGTKDIDHTRHLVVLADRADRVVTILKRDPSRRRSVRREGRRR
jgi:hypothetical protein